jgi:hypothetical protein
MLYKNLLFLSENHARKAIKTLSEIGSFPFDNLEDTVGLTKEQRLLKIRSSFRELSATFNFSNSNSNPTIAVDKESSRKVKFDF